LLFTCLAGITVADSICEKPDFEKFNGCMKENVYQLIETGTAPTDDLKEQVKQCFIESDCNPPDFDAPDESGGGDYLSALFGGVDMEKLTSALLQVSDVVSDNVDICVQAKSEYKSFVSLRASEFKGLDLQKLSTGQNDNIMRVMKSMQGCSANTGVKLMSCLKNLMKGSSLNAAFMKFCNGTSRCVSDLPCNATSVRTVLCSCARDHLNATTEEGSKHIYDYENMFTDILNKPRPTARARMHMGFFIKQMVEKICTENPCVYSSSTLSRSSYVQS